MSNPEGKKLFVVLILSNPPSPWKVADWYWKKIAGVPFLLRNILSIQEAGTKRLILFAEKSLGRLDELCRRLENDARVRLKLECCSEPEKLIASVKGTNRIVFLDGSILQNPARIEKTLEPGLEKQNQETNRTIILSPNNLEALMKRIDSRGLLPWLENMTDIPRETSPDTGITLAFVAGTEDWRITQPEDFSAVGTRLIKSCGLSNDSLMDQLVTRFISRQLTRQIIKTPITPNMITLVSCLVGLGAAACFLMGNYVMGVAGGGLLLLSTWIDCTDGEVARLKFMASSFGKQLDIICDNLVHMAVFFSIGLGLHVSTGNDLFIFLGGLSVLGCLVSFILLSPEIVKSKMRSDELKPDKNRKKSITDTLANRDFTYLLFFMALIARLDIFLALAAAGSNIFAGYLLYNRFKSASTSVGKT